MKTVNHPHLLEYVGLNRGGPFFAVFVAEAMTQRGMTLRRWARANGIKIAAARAALSQRTDGRRPRRIRLKLCADFILGSQKGKAKG